MNKIILIFSLFISIHAQMLHFNIVQDDDILGSMKLKRFTKNDTIFIELEATMTFTYFFMSHDYTQRADWSYTLDYFKYKMRSNVDSKETSVDITNQHQHYQFIRDSFLSSDSKVLDSIPFPLFETLYFEEPKNGQAYFASNYGKIFHIEKNEDGGYVYETDRNEWIFFYENGQLTKAQFDGFINYDLVNQTQRD